MEYTKMPATFLGPGKPYLDYLQPQYAPTTEAPVATRDWTMAERIEQFKREKAAARGEQQ
jgi:hypothetical protein